MAKSMVEVAAREEVDAAHMLLSLTGSGSIDKILGRSQLNGIALPSQPTAQQVGKQKVTLVTLVLVDVRCFYVAKNDNFGCI